MNLLTPAGGPPARGAERLEAPRIAYEYDTESRLLRVRNNTALFADFSQPGTYDDRGRLVRYSTGPVVHTVQYDVRDRVERLQSGSALDLTYTYNKVNHVLNIADTRPGMNQTFAYDNLDRLTQAIGPTARSAGPMTRLNNRLTQIASATTVYHYLPFGEGWRPNGNMPKLRLTLRNGMPRKASTTSGREAISRDPVASTAAIQFSRAC